MKLNWTKVDRIKLKWIEWDKSELNYTEIDQNAMLMWLKMMLYRYKYREIIVYS